MDGLHGTGENNRRYLGDHLGMFRGPSWNVVGKHQGCLSLFMGLSGDVQGIIQSAPD